MTEEMQSRLIGTNIDPRSLLSTDYFNHFNEVIMTLNMLPDMPDLLDEVDKWEFISYIEHFKASGLGFAPLAIEAYEQSPQDFRERFDRVAEQLEMLVIETRVKLREFLEAGDMDRFNQMAQLNSMQLQGLVDEGGAIVHGRKESADQTTIDDMF